MNEIQETMLNICFAGMLGVVLAENVIIIASAVKWVKNKIHKHKERKNTKD